MDETPTVDDLIATAARGTRRLTPAELQRVLAHVAQAGFDPNAREKARGRLAGIAWQGRILKGSDLLSPVEAHYLRHVITNQEWPIQTTIQEYVESIRTIILNPRNGVLTSYYQGLLQLTIVCRSGEWQGPNGYRWILVDYRVTTGHWMTAFQPERDLGELRSPRREDLRWLRRPR